jgi:hypothetical protein
MHINILNAQPNFLSEKMWTRQEKKKKKQFVMANLQKARRTRNGRKFIRFQFVNGLKFSKNLFSQLHAYCVALHTNSPVYLQDYRQET